MANDILIPKINGSPLGPVRPETDPAARIPSQEKVKGPSFKEVLDSKIQTSKPEAGVINDTGTLKFSKHAIDRMRSRGIGMDQELIKTLDRGLELLDEKNAKDSLIVTEKGAFIVNVPSKTVVTVVGSAKEQVFTNIDTAVIV